MLVYEGVSCQIFLVVLFLILHPLPSWQKRPYLFPETYIKSTNFICDFEPIWVANVSCKLKPISWEKTVANFNADLLQPLRNFSLHIQVFRLETQYVPFLVNKRINLCDILQRKGIDFYSRILLTFVNEYVRSKNFTCPFTGHLEFRDAYLKGSHVAPPGTYKFVLKGFEGYPPERVGLISIVASIIEKRRGSK